MEELESVLFLSSTDSKTILTALDNIEILAGWSQVLITAGAKGVLRFYHIQMQGKDVTTFTCTALWYLPISPLSSSEINTTLSEDMMTLKAIHSLCYQAQSHEIVAITNDFNIVGYTIDQIVAYGKQVLTVLPEPVLGGLNKISNASIRPSSLWIGHHGDILDMLTLPSTDTNNKMIALVTNSPQLRLLYPHTMQCEVLEGHTDIILAIDVSPTG